MLCYVNVVVVVARPALNFGLFLNSKRLQSWTRMARLQV